MGRLGQQFVRFPHRCTIYTFEGVTPFSDGEKTILWEGRCRKESNTSVRSFTGSDAVMKSDYRIQLGAIVGGELSGDKDASYDGRPGEECGAIVFCIKAGLLIDVVDKSGEVQGLSVTDVYEGNLGTSVYCNLIKT